jgi:hypothetical protein
MAGLGQRHWCLNVLGRNFNLSRHFGFNFEIGIGFLLYSKTSMKQCLEYPNGEPEARSTPNWGFVYSYRFSDKS